MDAAPASSPPARKLPPPFNGEPLIAYAGHATPGISHQRLIYGTGYGAMAVINETKVLYCIKIRVYPVI
jgi:hypothetical protein